MSLIAVVGYEKRESLTRRKVLLPTNCLLSQRICCVTAWAPSRVNMYKKGPSYYSDLRKTIQHKVKSAFLERRINRIRWNHILIPLGNSCHAHQGRWWELPRTAPKWLSCYCCNCNRTKMKGPMQRCTQKWYHIYTNKTSKPQPVPSPT